VKQGVGINFLKRIKESSLGSSPNYVHWWLIFALEFNGCQP
jgi:hypothetical protein